MTYRFAATCLITLLLTASAAGQGYRHNAQYFLQTHPALSTSNAAALSLLEKGEVCQARLSFEKENGGLIPLEGSDDAWKAGAATEAFRKVSDRLSYYGKLSYSRFRGQDMGGQVLMQPSYNPVNFLEEDFSTKGTKQRETYSLSGGIACTLSESVTLGTAVDYTSADQLKFKDPRFQNVWMDLSVRPGVLLRLSDTFRLGVNLECRQTLEKVNAGLYGTIDRDYSILVDMGNFYGPRERFEGDAGYISTTNERPLTHGFYGLSLQALIKRDGTEYCGELTALYHNGYFGSHTSSSVVFCEFRGPEISYTGTFVHPVRENLHKLAVEASFGLLGNYTNAYRHETEIGMTGKIVYLGQSQTNSRTHIRAAGAYTFFGDTSGFLPGWEVNARAEVFCKLQQTMLYPFNRDWNTVSVDVSASAGRNITRGKNIYSAEASASFLMGFGEPRKDSMAGGATTTYRSFDNYSDRQFEYETAGRMGIGLALRYSRILSEHFVPYVKLSDRFCTLLSTPRYLSGGSRNVAVVSIGCNF